MGARPTVISTFAGCGGSSLGYRNAGYEELLAIDSDANSVETFKLNFPDIPVWQRDIRGVSGKEIADFCKISAGELGVLDGSPPCQGFSSMRIRKRDVGDPRNSLFIDFVRLLKELKPKAFLMENVAGQARGKMRGTFIEIFGTLKGAGYDVRCRLMNSKNYGVPQSRPRLIYVGVRSDIGIAPSYPKPESRLISASAAIDGIENRTYGKIGPELVRRWHEMKPGQNHSAATGKECNFSTIKLDPRRPSPTITKTVRENMAGHLHWAEPRLLTIEEIKRLSSFPDDFKLTGKFSEQWARIGNAVMPEFMRRIATHIREEILDKVGDSGYNNSMGKVGKSEQGG